jgi:hypothetical protein
VDLKATTQTRGADTAKMSDHCSSDNSSSSHINTVQSYSKSKWFFNTDMFNTVP